MSRSREHNRGSWAGFDWKCPDCLADLKRKFGTADPDDAAESTCRACGDTWGWHNGAQCANESAMPCGSTTSGRAKRMRVERAAAGPDCPAEIAAIWAAL